MKDAAKKKKKRRTEERMEDQARPRGQQKIRKADRSALVNQGWVQKKISRVQGEKEKKRMGVERNKEKEKKRK
jgi:hypothetical protein